MKKIALLAIAVGLLSVSCKQNDASNRINEENVSQSEQASSETNGTPVIEFNETTHDFGDIANNESVETEFDVKNTGNADLVIINASASCGCTVPEYQKTPIKPGETSKLKVRFQTGATGLQQKTVTLKTNTEKGEELLTIKANVAPAQQ